MLLESFGVYLEQVISGVNPDSYDFGLNSYPIVCM